MNARRTWGQAPRPNASPTAHRRVVRSTIVCVAAVAAVVIQAACARSDETLPPDQHAFPSHGGPESVCIQTECPAPLATCHGASGLCTVDLSSDVQHCGACHRACPLAVRGGSSSWICSDGECKLACAPFYADCNGLEADGCETPTHRDPSNCGACGNTCDEGDLCWRGACGCPKGFAPCGDDCVRLDSDDAHCGACGEVCAAPEADDPRWTCGPAVAPSHTKWRCVGGECTLGCAPGYDDCNGDLCGDGCETFLGDDPRHCGACGRACAPDQRCKNGSCLCPPGTTRCGDECVDLESDPVHCGACGNGCPGPSSGSGRGGPTCVSGECRYVCFPGFADCDGWIGNGCEADLTRSQRNCGACGNACDTKNGQPCVDGVCLTRACDDPVVR